MQALLEHLAPKQVHEDGHAAEEDRQPQPSTTISTDYGRTRSAGDPANGISPLVDPFPIRRDGTRFNLPTKGVLGLMTLAGRDFSFTDLDTRHARQRRWRAGIQRQFKTNMVLSVSYAGSYADRVYITQDLAPLPGQYWADGMVRNDPVATYLRGNMPNPFRLSNFPGLLTTDELLYDDMNSVSFFRGSTVQRQQLMRLFPHMSDLKQNYAPLGEVRTDALEVTFQRRFSKGATINAGYTKLRIRAADYFANEFDPKPSWRQSNNGRPQRFTATGIYQLPFGKRRMFFKSGPLSRVFDAFQLAATYEWQPGPLIDFGNLFYYGNLEDINTGLRTLERWFNIDNFERSPAKGPANYHRRVSPHASTTCAAT